MTDTNHLTAQLTEARRDADTQEARAQQLLNERRDLHRALSKRHKEHADAAAVAAHLHGTEDITAVRERGLRDAFAVAVHLIQHPHDVKQEIE